MEYNSSDDDDDYYGDDDGSDSNIDDDMKIKREQHISYKRKQGEVLFGFRRKMKTKKLILILIGK